MIKLPVYKHHIISNESVINYFKDKEVIYTELYHSNDVYKDQEYYKMIHLKNYCGKVLKVYIENNQLYADIEPFDIENKPEYYGYGIYADIGNKIRMLLNFHNMLPDNIYCIVRYIKDDDTCLCFLTLDTIIGPKADKDCIINESLIGVKEEQKKDNEYEYWKNFFNTYPFKPIERK